MKKDQITIQKNASTTMNYEDALNYITEIYGANACSFDEKCIASFEYVVEDLNIVRSFVTYNLISVKIQERKTVYWPIKNYKIQLINGETVNLFEKIQRKYEERNAAS